MSVTATASFTYRGDYQTHGGRSQYEAGGSGTTFLSFPAEEAGKVETTLILDNQGKQPLAEFVNDVAADSARTYLVVSESESFTRVRVLGGAHLAVKKKDDTVGNVSVTIGNLEGDNSGMIHSSKEMRVTVADGVDPFPTSLRVYESSEMDLPPSRCSCDLGILPVHTVCPFIHSSGMVLPPNKCWCSSGILPYILFVHLYTALGWIFHQVGVDAVWASFLTYCLFFFCISLTHPFIHSSGMDLPPNKCWCSLDILPVHLACSFFASLSFIHSCTALGWIFHQVCDDAI